MIDEKQIKDVLQSQQAPKPDEDAKKKALAAAMEAFDEEVANPTFQDNEAETENIENNIQGITDHDRPKGENGKKDRKNKPSNFWSNIMEKRFIATGMTGAVAACALLVMLGGPTELYRQYLNPGAMSADHSEVKSSAWGIVPASEVEKPILQRLFGNSEAENPRDASVVRNKGGAQGQVGNETSEIYKKAISDSNKQRAEYSKTLSSSTMSTPPAPPVSGREKGQRQNKNFAVNQQPSDTKTEGYRGLIAGSMDKDGAGAGKADRISGRIDPALEKERDRIAPKKRAQKPMMTLPETKRVRESVPSNIPVPSGTPSEAVQRELNRMEMQERRIAPTVVGGIVAVDEEMVIQPVVPVHPHPEPVVGDDIVDTQYKDVGEDEFTDFKDNSVKSAKDEPVSTFSVDVDTSSYAFMRGMINNGSLPQKNAIRVEELINYFDYNYAVPESKSQPFQPTVAVYDSPWKPGNKLMHIGIKGHDMSANEKPRSNLVFLIDTSGSMNNQNKLPLLVNSMKLLVENLDPEDTIGIVTYAGRAGVALEPTKVRNKAQIIRVLENLRSGGSTAGAAGIRGAYDMAQANFDKEAVNRVILATDGDFNVGIRNHKELKDYIERKRESGVFLSVLGFGQGNYHDNLMQALAQNGNGNAAYIDTLSEARKVLVEEASSTLYPIAKDVKIQVEFNPDLVSEYRLIGYETRELNREDFNNDAVDAAEIGAGHTVTAIYEITPTSAAGNRLVDDLRYGSKSKGALMERERRAAPDVEAREYAYLKMRYKLPDENKSKLLTRPITIQDEGQLTNMSADIRFAAAVSAFGQKLRGGRYLNNMSYDDIITLAKSARGEDPFGYRAEFVNLVRLAKSASAMPR